MALVGAIAGGVVAVLVIAILVLTVVVILLALRWRKATANTDAIQLQPNVLYRESTEADRKDQTTYYIRTGIQMENNSFATTDSDTDTDAIQPNVMYL